MDAKIDLTRLLRTYKVLLDTSFAMDEGFPDFCRSFVGALDGNRILMPLVGRKELMRLSRHPNRDTSTAAQRALKTTGAMERDGKVEIRHEASDTFNDLVIQRIVEQHLLDHDFCVLTNDVGLMQDIYAKRHKQSVKGIRDVVVIKLHGRTHKPVLFVPNGMTAAAVAPAGVKPFAVASAPAQNIDTRLKARREVGESGVLYGSDGRKTKLEKEIAGGGEGRVFGIAGRSEVVKVYHTDKLTVGLEQKVALITGRRLDDPRVCWPLDVVRDADGVFRGFIMPRARGRSLRETLFVPKLFLRENPHWTRCQSVELGINILESIERLHSLNVLLGDINELNILMVDEEEIYFVDCDSYQVEGYSSPVGTVNFTAPEIQGRDFRTFLRTKEHELFAVATLLFMILLPGKCPYSHQGGEDGAANILEGHFPYPLGEDNPTDGAPLGHWRFCWSHLSYELKAAFYGSFDRGHLLPQRVPVKQWLRLLRKYRYFLSDAGKVFIGPSRQPGFDLCILPENYRRVPNQTEPSENGFNTDLEAVSRRIRLCDNSNRRSERGTAAASSPASTPGNRTVSAPVGAPRAAAIGQRARPKAVTSAKAAAAARRSRPIGAASAIRIAKGRQAKRVTSLNASGSPRNGRQGTGRSAGGPQQGPASLVDSIIGVVVCSVLFLVLIAVLAATGAPCWVWVLAGVLWLGSCLAALGDRTARTRT